jgi:hypothetical protein
MLGAALYFAGVKKDRIKEAMDTYIEEIDNFFKDDDGQMGMDEMIALIKHLKKSKPQLFS